MRSREETQRRRLFMVLLLTGGFCITEAIAAFLAHSSVLKADALHLTMDVSALAMSLTAMRIATRKPTTRFTFGLHRAEPLAAVVNAMLVMIGTVLIVKEGLENLGGEHTPIVGLMAKVSGAALIVNGISAYLLHGAIEHGGHHGHSHAGHSHGHVHAPAKVVAKKHEHHDHDHDARPRASTPTSHHDHEHANEAPAHAPDADHSMNLRGAWLHVLGDALGSVAALGTAGALALGAPPVIDLLASLLVAVILFLGAGRLLRDAAQVLLEGAPAHLAGGIVREIALDVDGVDDVVGVHVWTLGAGQDAAAVRVRGEHGVATRVEERLRSDLHLAHIWVHVEERTAIAKST